MPLQQEKCRLTNGAWFLDSNKLAAWPSKNAGVHPKDPHVLSETISRSNLLHVLASRSPRRSRECREFAVLGLGSVSSAPCSLVLCPKLVRGERWATPAALALHPGWSG